MQEDKEKSGVYAEPKDGDNLANLTGKFPAPPDTPYAGGTYEVDIVIPDQYPFKPPKMNIVNKIWHPNISSQTVSSPPRSIPSSPLLPVAATSRWLTTPPNRELSASTP